MRCIIHSHTDPTLNLAAEEHLLTSNEDECFMLWRNDRAIIVGRNQNTLSQIHPDFVRRHGIRVVRRLSGGGAVYHDLGNINYTCIGAVVGKADIDFISFTRPILDFLNQLGVPAVLDGRNDLTVHGLKISGNAQHFHHGRILHHGTLLFDVDLPMLAAALQVDPTKYQDKGVRSIRSRVANIREHLPVDMGVEPFMHALMEHMAKTCGARVGGLSSTELAAIETLAQNRYRQWDWNHGASPPYNFRRVTRTPGGTLELCLDVRDGIVRGIRIFGDYFGVSAIAGLEALLTGCRHDRESLASRLAPIKLDLYLKNVTPEQFIDACF